MRYMTGMGWAVETAAAADAEIEALPVALRARLVRLLEAVENVGLEALRAPHVRHLDGKLWELRVRADGGIARGIYVTAAGRRPDGGWWCCTCLRRSRARRRAARSRPPGNA